jgi:hypothetical protein
LFTPMLFDVAVEQGSRAFESNPSLVYGMGEAPKLVAGRYSHPTVEGFAGGVVPSLGVGVLLFQTCAFFATHASNVEIRLADAGSVTGFLRRRYLIDIELRAAFDDEQVIPGVEGGEMGLDGDLDCLLGIARVGMNILSGDVG